MEDDELKNQHLQEIEALQYTLSEHQLKILSKSPEIRV